MGGSESHLKQHSQVIKCELERKVNRQYVNKGGALVHCAQQCATRRANPPPLPPPHESPPTTAGACPRKTRRRTFSICSALCTVSDLFITVVNIAFSKYQQSHKTVSVSLLLILRNEFHIRCTVYIATSIT